MLAFWINKRRQADRVRHTTAGRQLDLGIDQRPRVQKKSLFGHIFTATKADITGVETLSPDRRQQLYRYGVWHDIDATELALRRWLTNWVKRGGIALI
jgi:hypothetical protein